MKDAADRIVAHYERHALSWEPGRSYLAYNQQRQGCANQSKKPGECRQKAKSFKRGHDASPNKTTTQGKKSGRFSIDLFAV
jgi:hypothetical protein